LLYLDGFRFFGAMLVVLKVWTFVLDEHIGTCLPKNRS
jgi:hypothetical protein